MIRQKPRIAHATGVFRSVDSAVQDIERGHGCDEINIKLRRRLRIYFINLTEYFRRLPE